MLNSFKSVSYNNLEGDMSWFCSCWKWRKKRGRINSDILELDCKKEKSISEDVMEHIHGEYREPTKVMKVLSTIVRGIINIIFFFTLTDEDVEDIIDALEQIEYDEIQRRNLEDEENAQNQNLGP
jgi:fructose-1,6-bisphosphatase